MAFKYLTFEYILFPGLSLQDMTLHFRKYYLSHDISGFDISGHDTLQWQIYIVKFWMRAPLPPGVQILSISCSFWENLAKSYVGAPPKSWRPLLGEILDPPLHCDTTFHRVVKFCLSFTLYADWLAEL